MSLLDSLQAKATGNFKNFNFQIAGPKEKKRPQRSPTNRCSGPVWVVPNLGRLTQFEGHGLFASNVERRGTSKDIAQPNGNQLTEKSRWKITRPGLAQGQRILGNRAANLP
jgi:hypothetical protein